MTNKLDPKEINGKKFKKTDINTILITAVVLWIPAIIITVLTGNPFPIPVVVILIYLLSTFTNIFCIGKVYCILAEDRLYYFDSISSVGRRTETTCGYLGYSEIKKAEIVKAPIAIKKHMLKVYGENFIILLPEATKHLLKQIKKKQESIEDGQRIPHYAEMEPYPERTGLFNEIWEDYENDELIKVFDSATKIESIINDKEFINITAFRNGTEILITINKSYLFIYLENKKLPSFDKLISKIEDMEHFYSIIEDFILNNT